MDVIEAEIKCQAERHASGDARRAAMDAECASHTRGVPLDDTNTNNMNKHMQQGRRGTTNFILVARAERPGCKGAPVAGGAETTLQASQNEGVGAQDRRARRCVDWRGKRKLQPLCAAICKPTVKGGLQVGGRVVKDMKGCGHPRPAGIKAEGQERQQKGVR